MQTELSSYSQFYKDKHKGRKLDWDHGLGTASIQARFPKGIKDLRVSLHQALVLLLFNEQTRIVYTDIKEETKIGKNLYSCQDTTY